MEMDDVPGSLEVRWMQGCANRSVAFVDDNTACYPCGGLVHFLNLQTGASSSLQSPGRGVAAFTASGSGGIFAFSEEKLSPSIFVYAFPEMQMRSELKGAAQVDFLSLALSDGGPYLAGCSSFPDHAITVWNWETAESLCSRPLAGRGVTSLVFNPLSWLQVCALGSSSLTVWNIERSTSVHILRPSVIELPAADGSSAEGLRAGSRAASTGFTYYGPEMPPSAITGLGGDEAEGILAAETCTRARLTPAAICWTGASQLYVGCEEGFLLLVDPESLCVTVLFNPTRADADPELKRSGFRALALSKDGLIAAGKESAVHSLQAKELALGVARTWRLEEPVAAVIHSPDCETLLLPSDTGRIYALRNGNVMKVPGLSGDSFAAAAFLHCDKNICVSARESGELQLWSADGVCLSSLPLGATVASLACCPAARYAAVGTSSGHVLLVDLSGEQRPRVVRRVRLYRGPVDHLVFDEEGLYLLAGASDPHVYVLNARPSRGFSVIGYAVLPGPVLSLSTRSIPGSQRVKVLALCAQPGSGGQDGSRLTLFTLPARDVAGPDCVDGHGRLSDGVLNASNYDVPHPVRSCVLGVGDVFAYCHRRQRLQRFQPPQDPGGISSSSVVQLTPVQEVRGHPIGPASLVLSPHQPCLASVGRDGLLRIHDPASMELLAERRLHSHRLGGARSASFSPDGRTLVSAGVRDGCLACTGVRIKGLGAEAVNKPGSRPTEDPVRNAENRVLTGLPEWSQESEKTEEQDGSAGSSPPVDPPSSPTWLESRQKAVADADALRCSETREKLRARMEELRRAVQEMIRENQSAAEAERRQLRDFNLDAEEQGRLDAAAEREVARVRSQMELEILQTRYLCDHLKRECWDALKVQGRAVQAFHSEHRVNNFPLRERTEEQMEDLRRVETMRALEKAACAQRRQKQNPGEAAEGSGEAAESAALTGSYAARLGCSHPHLYDQFSLHTTEQKINQIILLQDVIHRAKAAFNAEFDAAHRRKAQEVQRAGERSRRIGEIAAELGRGEELWEPALSAGERPDGPFAPDDSEITAEKFLRPGRVEEEEEEEEERKRLEEQRRQAAKAENVRERALDDMMDGVLEVKREGFLKMEVARPEFVLTKPDAHWSEEEKRAHKDYERKARELSEEKEKHKKLLEAEMKNLHASNRDAAQLFDESLKRLFERKIEYQMAVYQEELKITYLACAVHTEEAMGSRGLGLKLQLEKALALEEELGEEVKRREREVELLHEAYEGIVAEDSVLDKEFRKEFFDVPRSIVDHLYKLFKRRPRVQKMRTQVDQIDPNQSACTATPAPDGGGRLQVAMEELDAPENMPEGLNAAIWERFCAIRRLKAASEQKVRGHALTLAEMQAFLQRRRDEDQAARQEVKNLTEELESLHKEKNRFLMDVMVQLLLKQGQVEVPAADFTPDYSGCVLLHRAAVEDLNSSIRALGEQKLAAMAKARDLRGGVIRLEWEKKSGGMQIEDLRGKARSIQTLQLTENQKKYLGGSAWDRHMTEGISALRKTIAFQEKTHLKDARQCRRKIRQLSAQAAARARKNADLDRQIRDAQVTVSEIRHVYEVTAAEENEAAKAEARSQEVVQRRKLKDAARAQQAELAVLGAELERLMRKNFPSLEQLKHD